MRIFVAVPLKPLWSYTLKTSSCFVMDHYKKPSIIQKCPHLQILGCRGVFLMFLYHAVCRTFWTTNICCIEIVSFVLLLCKTYHLYNCERAVLAAWQSCVFSHMTDIYLSSVCDHHHIHCDPTIVEKSQLLPQNNHDWHFVGTGVVNVSQSQLSLSWWQKQPYPIELPKYFTEQIIIWSPSRTLQRNCFNWTVVLILHSG